MKKMKVTYGFCLSTRIVISSDSVLINYEFNQKTATMKLTDFLKTHNILCIQV